jgi:hypothetical protein
MKWHLLTVSDWKEQNRIKAKGLVLITSVSQRHRSSGSNARCKQVDTNFFTLSDCMNLEDQFWGLPCVTRSFVYRR